MIEYKIIIYCFPENTGVIDSLWALVLTPTRELAIQVKNHFRDICMFTNIKVSLQLYFYNNLELRHNFIIKLKYLMSSGSGNCRWSVS